MVIKIYTYVDKRPDFIPYQLKSLKFFLTDEFEYIIFNNASNFVNRWKINNLCKKLGVKVYPIKTPIHSNPNMACAYPIQWSFHNIIKKQKNSLAVILDSDIFLLKIFSIRKYLDGFNIAGTKQIRGKVKYLWNGILFFNLRTLPNIDDLNFMCGLIDRTATDVGGNLHYYFSKKS